MHVAHAREAREGSRRQLCCVCCAQVDVLLGVLQWNQPLVGFLNVVGISDLVGSCCRFASS